MYKTVSDTTNAGEHGKEAEMDDRVSTVRFADEAEKQEYLNKKLGQAIGVVILVIIAAFAFVLWFDANVQYRVRQEWSGTIQTALVLGLPLFGVIYVRTVKFLTLRKLDKL